MGSMISLGVGRMEIDWGKNNVFRNHSSLFKTEDIKSIPYWHFVVQNRAMLDAIFAVYLSLKEDDDFSLCWGELSLRG